MQWAYNSFSFYFLSFFAENIFLLRVETRLMSVVRVNQSSKAACHKTKT